MKKIIPVLIFVFSAVFVNAQCIPNSSYQDSMYNIWPDTIQKLPHAM